MAADLKFSSALDDSQFTAGIRRMDMEVKRFSNSAGSAFTELQNKIPGGGILSRFGVGPREAAAGATIAAIRQIAVEGDKLTASLARIGASTGGLDSAKDAYDKLLSVSSKTGVAVEESAGMFTRYTIAARQIGATSDEVIKLVGLVQKAGVVGGSSTQETAAAAMQLGQALASGRFQGDELRSIMENMPLLAESLARQLGVSVGELRKMGTEGRLTTDRVFPALLKSAEEIDRKFSEMPVTMQRGFAQLGIFAKNTLAQIDQQIGASKFFGTAASMAAGNSINSEFAAEQNRIQIEGAKSAIAQAEATIEASKRARAGLPAQPTEFNKPSLDDFTQFKAEQSRDDFNRRQFSDFISFQKAEYDKLIEFQRQQYSDFVGFKTQKEADESEKAINKFATQERAKALAGLREDLAAAQDRQGAAADAFQNANDEMRAFNRMSPDERRQANREAADERRIAAREARMAKSGARDARAGAGQRLADIADAKQALDISDASIDKLVAEINKLIVAP